MTLISFENNKKMYLSVETPSQVLNFHEIHLGILSNAKQKKRYMNA